MRIKAYKSDAYTDTRIYETNTILCNLSPAEMTDEDRENFHKGAIPMLNFYDSIQKTWYALPVQFVIEIK